MIKRKPISPHEKSTLNRDDLLVDPIFLKRYLSEMNKKEAIDLLRHKLNNKSIKQLLVDINT